MLTVWLAGLLLERVQAEFLLGYKQLINNDVNSFDDYKDQIAALTVKPKAITLGEELGLGNYGRVHRAVLRPAAGSALGAALGGPVTVAVKVPVSAGQVHGEAPHAQDVERGAVRVETPVQTSMNGEVSGLITRAASGVLPRTHALFMVHPCAAERRS